MSRTINKNYKRKNFNKKFTSSKGDAIASNYFRRQLNEWRQASLEEHNRRCVISGETENLDIHHINVRFKDILKEAHENLNKEQHRLVTQYSIVDLTLIKQELLRLHFLYGLGVPITHNLHKKYHSIYKDEINATTFHAFVNEIRGSINEESILSNAL